MYSGRNAYRRAVVQWNQRSMLARIFVLEIFFQKIIFLVRSNYENCRSTWHAA